MNFEILSFIELFSNRNNLHSYQPENSISARFGRPHRKLAFFAGNDTRSTTIK